MESARIDNPKATLMSHQTAAVLAQTDRVLMVANSNERQPAQIAERRTQVRRMQAESRLPMFLVLGAMAVVFSTGLMFG